MCDFVSWIEYNDQLYYLTKDCLKDRRIKEIYSVDISGHGAIAAFYDIQCGCFRKECKECTDFSSPKNFPAEIVATIKNGEFRGIGSNTGLLSAEGDGKYFSLLYEPWREERTMAMETREKCKTICEQIYADFSKCKIKEAEYGNRMNKALKAREGALEKARIKYWKLEQKTFWDIFAIKKYRAKAWR